jgi:hypothetical protein
MTHYFIIFFFQKNDIISINYHYSVIMALEIKKDLKILIMLFVVII